MLRRTFLDSINYPFVIVSTLLPQERESVINFCLQLSAPVYLEAISGIREEPRLNHLKISHIDTLWKTSTALNYPIDGIIRIGGVPTLKPWRDLEDRKQEIPVFSFSRMPFPGLSRGTLFAFEDILHGPPKTFDLGLAGDWLRADKNLREIFIDLMKEEPGSEISLLRDLSQAVGCKGFVYLGNSLPIRYWDLAASDESKEIEIAASRGVNGIDGQLSTFFGMANPGVENVGIFGDLTTLYDLAAPWILSHLPELSVKIIVMNNGGGKIFSKMSPRKEFQNLHQYHFENFAKLWGLDYYAGTVVPETSPNKSCVIELLPNSEATDRLWKKYLAEAEKLCMSFCQVS